jgi:hypothetical protein
MAHVSDCNKINFLVSLIENIRQKINSKIIQLRSTWILVFFSVRILNKSDKRILKKMFMQPLIYKKKKNIYFWLK